ncbi:hypothetical protein, partial [Aeromonas caviae]|uniref:hypothetical protein n=1 Tax=Aeromonas caviae TaxID=648 RepID=UPI001CC5B2A0
DMNARQVVEIERKRQAEIEAESAAQAPGGYDGPSFGVHWRTSRPVISATRCACFWCPASALA